MPAGQGDPILLANKSAACLAANDPRSALVAADAAVALAEGRLLRLQGHGSAAAGRCRPRDRAGRAVAFVAGDQRGGIWHRRLAKSLARRSSALAALAALADLGDGDDADADAGDAGRREGGAGGRSRLLLDAAAAALRSGALLMFARQQRQRQQQRQRRRRAGKSVEEGPRAPHHSQLVI